jgi:NAD(P)-binding Rossmann-like domain
MRRRTLLLGAGVAGAAAAAGAGFWKWQEIPTRIAYPGRDVGHRLRDVKPSDWPAPSAEYVTDVAIVGSGIAGLTTAWRLAREGHTRFALVLGPEPHGNAASGAAEIGGESLRYPTGAHYLPLPSRESSHVRAMLADFGILSGPVDAIAPRYDERVVVHAPDERLFRDGRWQEGLVPEVGGSARGGRRTQDGESATDRFFAFVDGLRATRGADGRRVFTVPVALSSADPAWTALDGLSFAAWLEREGHTDPALRWYLDYCCRDDYGACAAQVSAWAGLHYFASRDGQAANAERGAVLTWPEGLEAMASRLDAGAFAPRGGPAPLRLPGVALSIRDGHDGVEVLCARSNGAHVSTYRIRARRVVSAMPLVVAKHVVAALGGTLDLRGPRVAPWIVANALLRRHPEEEDGAALAWDNVLFGSDGLGYVDANHEAIRVAPSEATAFTTYRAFGDGDPDAARRWLDRASASELGELATAELKTVYGWRLAACLDRLEVTVRGHAMASPAPGTLADRGLRALREADGAVLFAHADLSGYSVFEEAAWWGWQAAERILAS